MKKDTCISLSSDPVSTIATDSVFKSLNCQLNNYACTTQRGIGQSRHMLNSVNKTDRRADNENAKNSQEKGVQRAVKCMKSNRCLEKRNRKTDKTCKNVRQNSADAPTQGVSTNGIPILLNKLSALQLCEKRLSLEGQSCPATTANTHENVNSDGSEAFGNSKTYPKEVISITTDKGHLDRKSSLTSHGTTDHLDVADILDDMEPFSSETIC